uniref:Uncharacterized protein n=1 Tax=Ignisphaera aggregans TaxID=334771 RepID=A0A7J3QF79_9CREN
MSSMESYEICARRAVNNIIPGFVQLIEILSSKSFVHLVKCNEIRDVLSKIYSTEVVDIIVRVLVRRIEEVCGKDC